ncbi:Homeodomain-like [Phytophthora cactorum]|nr:Homeodomain-like [Phytophthora cactorum]
MERRGVGKRLTDGQRVEILKLFQSGAAVTEADVARRYGVTRSAIWRLRRSGQHILERYQEGDVQSRDERRRGAKNSSGSNRSYQPAAAHPDPVQLTAAIQTESAQQQQVQSPEVVAPLIYMSAKSIGSVQSPGLLNWERLSGHGDEEVFEVVNDGISVLQEGNYQINVDLQHSQPRQNYKVVFKVWHDRTLLAQCSCPLRTKKEISLSLLELRCQLPALAKLRVEFLAPGFAFHESRIALRLVQ